MMEDIPGKWDKHFEEMMKKASRKMGLQTLQALYTSIGSSLQ
jgi:hypothetical protein